MPIRKVETTDAFVVTDLEDAARAVGAVRMAPKILRDGAALLARSLTYQYASFGWQVSGASAGINARADEREGALAAFLAAVGNGGDGPRLLLEPARGLAPTSLDDLLAAADAPPAFTEARVRLRGRGAAAAAEAALGTLEGRSVVVESLDPVSCAFAIAAAASGAELRAFGTPAGVLLPGDGAASPTDVLAAGGDAGALASLGRLEADQRAVEVAADVLAVGSKAGLVDHLVAAELGTTWVVPVGPAPVTARGLAVLRRGGGEVLPDFLSLGGGAFASEAAPDEAVEAVDDRARAAIAAAVAEVRDHPEGPYLGACERAEAFLATWRPSLPFGRPLA